jgi:hypothetical protein
MSIVMVTSFRCHGQLKRAPATDVRAVASPRGECAQGGFMVNSQCRQCDLFPAMNASVE